MSLVTATIKRDLLLAARNAGEWLNPLMFFLMVAALFPLAVDPDPKFLSKIAGGVIWVAALLATLLSLMLCIKPMLKTARWSNGWRRGNLCTPWRCAMRWCIGVSAVYPLPCWPRCWG